MLKTVQKAGDAIVNIKRKLNTGILDYYEAKDLAQPHLKVINERALVIAKKFGKKHHPFTFTGMMR